MPRWTVLVPLVGAAVAASVPLVRYTQGRAAEETAIAALTTLQQVQRQLHARNGSYTTDPQTLRDGCADAQSAFAAEAFEDLREAGYEVQLRARAEVTADRQDCRGRRASADYYLAVSPRDITSRGQRAYAATASGPIYVFFDGIAPREEDMGSGLAPLLTDLPSFKIP